MIKKTVLWITIFYRNHLKTLMLPACKFHPSCSDYAQQAIEKYGVLKGSAKGAFRILRCNPFSKGGYDPA